MTAEESIMKMAEAIADGSPVDWPAADNADATALSDTVRELRVIAEIAALHRQQPEPDPASSADSPPRDSSARPDFSKAVPWGPLLILEQVGRGSFGDVYRAWDPSLDHEVALKLMRQSGLGSSSLASSRVREGQLLARVRHPNVITVHGACEIDGDVGIWMEFLRGRTLERLVQDEGPMSPQEASVVGDCLCRALAAVHRAGLLHQDVKASNVMREAGGRIVLLDFGLGSEVAVPTVPGTVRLAGTPLYLAPELLDGAAASVQSEIYSLGVLLFYLVTGTYPVRGRSLQEVRAAHQTGRRVLVADLRPDLPRNFVRALERAVSPAPKDRYESVGTLLHDLTESDLPQPGPTLSIPYIGLWILAAVTVGVWAVGLLTTLAFNVTLGRVEGFGSESLVALWIWGVRSLILPAAVLMAVGLTYMFLGPICRLLGRVAARVGRRVPWFESARLQVLAGGAGLRRIDANALGQALLMSQVLTMVLLSWRFGQLLQAVPHAKDASLASLAPLGPQNRAEQHLFTISVTLAILAMSAAWILLLRSPRTGPGRVSGTTTGAGLAVIALLIALVVVPYRVIWQSKFERVEFEGARCYIVGTRQNDVLLYCPDKPPPKNLIVVASDARIHRATVVESIFTPPD